MNARWFGLALILPLATMVAAVADIPAPRRNNPAAVATARVPVTIKHEALGREYSGAEARIIIPKSLLPAVAQQQSVYTGGPTSETPRTLPWTTVLAGIALAAAAASGVWVLRRREARLVATAALLVVASCAAWNLAHGDLIVPGGKGPRRPPSPRDAPPRPSTTIIIETPDDGDTVTLILKPKT